MKTAQGSSVLIYLVLSFVFLALVVFIPYPHYNLIESEWYFGRSIGGRLMGEKDEGVPLEKIARTLITQAVASPFKIECRRNEDCKNYTVTSQCRVYCGNLISDNLKVVEQLNKNRVCDTGLWKANKLDCFCVQGKCVDFED